MGEAFSRRNPDVAGLLSARAMDPDVERLLEGFAFLTGRLRQRIDEELPELAHGLLNLLWPHYLRPTPALTIVEFDAPPAGGATLVPAGSGLASRPVEGTACRFRTCHDLPLVPATIGAVELEERATTATLAVRLEATQGSAAAALAGRPVRLFLHGIGEMAPGPQLLHALLRETEAIEVTDGARRLEVPPGALGHAGLSGAGLAEAALPWPGNSFPGYRVLQEYLVFPERFLFLDLPAVPGAESLVGARLTWRFHLRRRPELPGRVQRGHVRLNCVPAVNLFEASGRPIVPDPGRVEHQVRPQGLHAAASVFAIAAVEGTVQGRGERIVIEPFVSYRHALPGASGAFYATRLRPSVLGRGADTWISFVDARTAPVLPHVSTVVIGLLCTDGELARQVTLGALDRPGIGSPVNLPFCNVTRVSDEVPPPLGGDLMWRLVSGLARSLQPLGDIAALRALVAAYDMRAPHDEQAQRRLERMLAALLAIESVPMETLVKGVPVRGREIRLTLAESGFGGIAGTFLFGAVFEAFLGVYAGLNTCWRLVVLGSETRAELRWPIRMGQAPIP
nr:type VI secretion system baseplate subunit TssF [Roseomonas acroporae]